MQRASRDYANSSLEHVYSVCFFDRGWVIPEVVLIDAATDEDALEEARLRRPFTTREVWMRHRLVGVIRPKQLS